MTGTNPNVLVVGGSLAGLTCGLAFANEGIRVRILERVEPRGRVGTGLGVDRSALAEATGLDPTVDGMMPQLPVVISYRESTSWLALHNWLRGHAVVNSLICLDEGMAVMEVTQSHEGASALLEDGTVVSADAIIGADGYQSIVRRAVNPGQPHAEYAGYLLWRGLADERKMDASTKWPRNGDGLGVIDAAGYRLVAYPVPGEDGSVVRGERQISFAWYDATRTRLLRQYGCLSNGDEVLGTLTSNVVARTVGAELLQLAERIWPEPWSGAVLQALKEVSLIGTPICEYLPERLSCGRVAIVGDAAHVGTPATGRGFATAVDDAKELARQLSTEFGKGAPDVVDALSRYEQSRLEIARSLSAASRRWSREYISMIQQHRRRSVL